MILAILYREMPHMLPAKYQPNPLGGSGEEDPTLGCDIGRYWSRLRSVETAAGFDNC